MQAKNKADNRIINVRPLCIAAVCFIAGIFCAYKAICGEYLLAVLPLAVFCLVIMGFCIFKGLKGRSFLLLFFVICLIFFFLGAINLGVRADIARSVPNLSGRYYGKITEIKKYDSHRYRIVFKNRSLDGREVSGNAVCYIFSESVSKKLLIGGEYAFDCKLENRLSSGESATDIFAGNYYSITVTSEIEFVRDSANIFQKTQRYIKQLLKSGMNDKSYPISIALVLGDVSEIESSVLSNYRASGIAHVFAVSGLHVGTLALAISFICKKLKLGRYKTLFAVAIPLIFYTGVCGFSASSVRACIMSILLLLSGCVGFKRDTLSAIALAALIITAVKPSAFFEAGFKLSFTAVVSVVILSPVFLRGTSGLKSLSKALSATLSASFGTLPIITDMSGYISVISLLANLIFVPIVMLTYQFLIICTGLAVLENLFFGSSSVCLFLPDKIIYAIDYAVGLFDFARATVPFNFGNLTALYYVGLIAVSDVVNLTVKNKVIIGVITVCSILIISCV